MEENGIFLDDAPFLPYTVVSRKKGGVVLCKRRAL